jgi:uncharacterized protein YlzI (FlbEa/FlbD family)
MLEILIILHSLNGAEITVNPKLITAMKAGIPGEKNKDVAQGANCAINMADGKFITVIETCDKVRELIRRRE